MKHILPLWLWVQAAWYVHYLRAKTIISLTWKVVPQESAVIAGTADSEVLGFAKDHKELVRFENQEDQDFRSVALLLDTMVKRCPESVRTAWAGQEAARVSIMDERKKQASHVAFCRMLIFHKRTNSISKDWNCIVCRFD